MCEFIVEKYSYDLVRNSIFYYGMVSGALALF